jgi:aspartate/methionine/tyrosine aminotransferase
MTVRDSLEEQRRQENEAIRAASPALAAALSPLGVRTTFPPDIPFQAAAARGKKFNATIGQITDGAGRPLALPTLSSIFEGLPETERSRAFLYSPVEGLADLRRSWRQWQRRDVEATVESSLPVVTVGLTHGLSLMADLFGGENKPVAIPSPFWGNYRQTFGLRTGARILTAPAYVDEQYNVNAIPQALSDVPEGEPALALLNFPSNPGGYAPTDDERIQVRQALCEEADRRPLIVLCDDAYAGLVYEPEVSSRSIFWDLCDAHPNLVPVKLDGATKEFVLFGGRVGFLTFPFAPESAAAQALESKLKCLIRAAIGSPVATSQVLLLQALGTGSIAKEIEAVRSRLAERYRVLKVALADLDPALLRLKPCNSGCFALLELPQGLEPHAVRQHLLDRHDTGLVALGDRFIRIAFCSVNAESLPELVARLERGVAELVGG